jgi:hypothetical protein
MATAGPIRIRPNTFRSNIWRKDGCGPEMPDIFISFFSIAQKEPPEKIAKTRCKESESLPAKKRLKVLTRNK